MRQSSTAIYIAVLAFSAAAFGSAQAASETTRRNYNTIQTYQNRQQGPYYTGRTNPYYGAAPQGGGQVNSMPPPQRRYTPELQNQIRANERRSTGR